MPKIDAPTIAEHRANQENALLAAARALLLSEGPHGVTPAAVGAAAGLARSSVYKYFRSGDEILTRIVADSFAEWGAQVRDTVERAETAAGRIEAYVRTTLALAAAGDHRIAVLGGGLPRDEESRARLANAHHDLAAPLRSALTELGVSDPELTAILIDGALARAIDLLDADHPSAEIIPKTVGFIQRAVGITHHRHRPRPRTHKE
ncbi:MULTISPECIES: TetR/AcrR family transcriptional regulator [unclassified Nocardia]|uniref:TetR/AcrR family transcriptional regulator n=1 Tax=unclassified Nocardia TaxID=2637762 RepID=UPI001CE400FB|nr:MULTISPECIES: TetR family transcriptional regulator [unclassified Nocardia]